MNDYAMYGFMRKKKIMCHQECFVKHQSFVVEEFFFLVWCVRYYFFFARLCILVWAYALSLTLYILCFEFPIWLDTRMMQ